MGYKRYLITDDVASSPQVLEAIDLQIELQITHRFLQKSPESIPGEKLATRCL